MTMFDAAAERRIMDRVEEIDKDFRAGLRRRFEGVPAGQEEVDDETWAAHIDLMAERAGSGVVTDEETGREFFANYFFLALAQPNVDGGAQLLARYARIRGGG